MEEAIATQLGQPGGSLGEAQGKHGGSWGKHAVFGGSTPVAPLEIFEKMGEAIAPSTLFIILKGRDE